MAGKDEVIEISDDEEEQQQAPKKKIEDFEEFKKQNNNVQEILDKLVIKREYFIPASTQDINKFYNFDKELGEGAYGKVFLGIHKKTKA